MPVMKRMYSLFEWFFVALALALTVALVWMTLHLKNIVATEDAQDALKRLRFFVETQPVSQAGAEPLSLQGVDAIHKQWPDWSPGDVTDFAFSAEVSGMSYVIVARGVSLFDRGCQIAITHSADRRKSEFTDCAGSSGNFVDTSEYY